MTDSPFDIVVYDRAFVRQGWIVDPVSVKFTPRHMNPGAVTVTVDSDHLLVPALLDEGARLVVTYRGETVSGWITQVQSDGPAVEATVTVTVTGDLIVLQDMLGWPAPGSPINSQGTAYDRRSGPFETVLKGFVAANKARFPYIDVAADLGRGPTVKEQSRMANLWELLSPLAGTIGISAVQVGTKIIIDCYEPDTWPVDLSEEGGTVVNWSWTRATHTGSRAIVMGAGEMTAREFRQVTDTARESSWTRRRELAVDARDLQLDTGSADYNTQAKVDAAMDARGQAALDDAAPKAGLSITLAETDGFGYGDNGVRVGDVVTVAVGPTTITDYLAEANVTWDTSNGDVAEPVIGDRTDDPTRALVAKVRELGVKLARLQRSL